MLLSRTIQYKALLMLTVFAANFFIVCNCSARPVQPAGHSSCCAQKQEKPPCKDGKECGGMHAVKFNLLEKQAAKEMIYWPPAYTIVHTLQWKVPIERVRMKYVGLLSYKQPHPDYQALFQCFLI